MIIFKQFIHNFGIEDKCKLMLIEQNKTLHLSDEIISLDLKNNFGYGK